MLTVPEAARRVGRNPETIRRWIRAGRLHSQRVGTQHLVDERDLEEAAFGNRPRLPKPLREAADGRVQPDWVAIIRDVRDRPRTA